WEGVGERTRSFVEKKKGTIIPIPGFDEVMLLLYSHLLEPLKWPDLFERLKERARAREDRFDTQMKDLKESLRPKLAETGALAEEPVAAMSPEAGEVNGLLREAAGRLTKKRVEKPWWEWEDEASAAVNAEEKEAVYRAGLEALPRNAPLLGNYANFLSDDRKDYDRAEEFYKRAIEADPKDADFLGNYAIFLKNVRKDYDRAEEFYKRAIEADPKHANTLGNYAGLLFARGRLVEAIGYAERAEAAQEKGSGLEAELLFYRAAHVKDSWPSVLTRLRQVLESGTRSPGWNLEANIERASQDGHPNVPLLRALASVITEGGDLSLLTAYPEWIAAGETA
ncbi:MAG: tetratricopeptide repeat protein, partial [Bryobacteraceae bacterium]